MPAFSTRQGKPRTLAVSPRQALKCRKTPNGSAGPPRQSMTSSAKSWPPSTTTPSRPLQNMAIRAIMSWARTSPASPKLPMPWSPKASNTPLDHLRHRDDSYVLVEPRCRFFLNLPTKTHSTNTSFECLSVRMFECSNV